MAGIIKVTQAQLQTFLQNRLRAKEESRKVGAQRRQLIVQIQAGAVIEDGELIARASRRGRQRLTWENVAAILGDQINVLRAAIETKYSNDLVVIPRSTSADVPECCVDDNEFCADGD